MIDLMAQLIMKFLRPRRSALRRLAISAMITAAIGMHMPPALAQNSQAEPNQTINQERSNPFSGGRGTSTDAPAPQTEPRANPFGNRVTSADPPPSPIFVMPASVRAVFRQIADWQRQINRYLARQLQATKGQGGITAALTVILASFIYGVLHAAGPGHGKLVVASYFTAREAPLRTGILMGGIIALTQAAVAILMVAVLAILLDGSQLEIIDQTALLEVVSYGLILAIGTYMTYVAVTGSATCGHAHSGSDEHHEHDHAHSDDHHGHNHGPDPAAKETWLARTAGRWLGPQGEVIAVGIVSGIRPCTGSILVLLFAMANGVFLLGVIASVTMAAGVAITISALGIGAIVLRRSVTGRDDMAPTPARAFLGRSLSIAGSLAVAILGGLLFGGALERTGFLI
jgi:nickel/cobalt transporter (NicO) family protein